MIPEQKTAAVRRALSETFGVSECRDIQRLNTEKLTSAEVFRIVVRGRPYVLRVITRADANTDPTHQFSCMKIAAEAGLAPRVLYTSIEDRVSLIDFHEARPLPPAEAAVRLAAALRALHALRPFPPLVNDYDTSPTFLLRPSSLRDGFFQSFRAARILPDRETAEVFQMFEQVSGIYRRDDGDMVSSHNDLKPENILFDGDRVWLVDWEAAFLNDRYSDLGVAANFVVTNDAEEDAYLRTYFAEAPGEYRSARFYLMRQVAHMFYGMAFMLRGSATGEDAKLQDGKAQMNRLLQNVRAARFQEALKTISR